VATQCKGGGHLVLVDQYVVRHLANENGVDVGYVARPSYVDDDELASIAGPAAISAAEMDIIFPAQRSDKINFSISHINQINQIKSNIGFDQINQIRYQPSV
jgi:hypothetical protein